MVERGVEPNEAMLIAGTIVSAIVTRLDAVGHYVVLLYYSMRFASTLVVPDLIVWGCSLTSWPR